MRRPLIAIAGTLAGIAMLIGLKFGAGGPAVNVQASSNGGVPAGQEQAAASPGNQGAAGDNARAKPPRTRKPRAVRGVPKPGGGCGGAGGAGGGGAGAGGGAKKSGTFVGAASTNEYGTIKVTIRVANGKMTNVTATYPTTPATTKSINNGAIPKLKAAALAAQSAKIATVSGATFTSKSYKASLQSALSKAASGAAGNAGGGAGAGGGAKKSGTFVGAASTNEYGTIKVTIRVANGKMTNVTATFPTTPATTKSINNGAIPKLKAAALAAQSAKIATVSGATFTSKSYKASLQSALSKAGL